MPDNYYDDAPQNDAPTAPSDEQQSDQKTSILPKSFFCTPPEVGKGYEVEIVAIHESDVEVKCKGTDDDEDDQDDESAEPAPDDGAAEPSDSGGSMSQMMQ